MLLGIGAVGYFYLNPLPESFTANTEVSPENKGQLRRTNDTDKPMTVILADGSSVVLLPGSVLEYAAEGHPKRREVRLVGRAFF